MRTHVLFDSWMDNIEASWCTMTSFYDVRHTKTQIAESHLEFMLRFMFLPAVTQIGVAQAGGSEKILMEVKPIVMYCTPPH